MFGGVAARLTGTDPIPAPKAYGHYDPKALRAQLSAQGMLPDTKLLPNIPEMDIWHQQADEKNKKIKPQFHVKLVVDLLSHKKYF